MRKKMIYLASVYSIHAKTDSAEHKAVRQQRAEYAMDRAAKIFENDLVFSPIAHCHEMSERNDMGKSYESWQDMDRYMISICDEVHVLMMPHWENSVGITDEIRFAKGLGKPVIYLDASDYEGI